MRDRKKLFVLGLGALLSGCAASGSKASNDQVVTGWYMQHAAQASFQPCGTDKRLSIETNAGLRKQAADFGLTDDTPVYAKLKGSMNEGRYKVSSVVQFGSPQPIRGGCAMTGVVVPSPG